MYVYLKLIVAFLTDFHRTKADILNGKDLFKMNLNVFPAEKKN